MSHECHHPHCKRLVPPRMFACKAHWYSLPQKIRDAIWREYRPGQENDKKPSLRYMAVQRVACAYLVFKPHDEKATEEALQYLVQGIRYSRAAIAEGLGDPLEGLTPNWGDPTKAKPLRPRPKLRLVHSTSRKQRAG